MPFASYLALGRDGLMNANSYGYLMNAEELARQIASGAVPAWGSLGADLQVMPMYTWFLTLNVLIAGHFAPLDRRADPGRARRRDLPRGLPHRRADRAALRHRRRPRREPDADADRAQRR